MTSIKVSDREAVETGHRQAQLVWFDPGVTTGVVICAIRPRWLRGEGDPSWVGLGKAVTVRHFAQLGRHAKVVRDGKAAPVPAAARIVEGVEALKRAGRRGRGSGSQEITTGEVDELNAVLQCVGILDIWTEAAWGFEDFIPRSSNASRDFLAPVRIFSRLDFVELVYGEKGRWPFRQNASLAKTTATDARLRDARLYMPGMEHATDAARHAATFLRRCRTDAALRELAWPKLFARKEAVA
jgi:hypothetical protein